MGSESWVVGWVFIGLAVLVLYAMIRGGVGVLSWITARGSAPIASSRPGIGAVTKIGACPTRRR